MLKLLEKLKKYIAEHYTGEEPFVENRKVFCERLLEAPGDEKCQEHSSSMGSVCNHCVSKRNDDFSLNNHFESNADADLLLGDSFEEMNSLENDSLYQEKSVALEVEESYARLTEAHRPQEAAQLMTEKAVDVTSGMMFHKAFKRMDSLDDLLHKKPVTFADKLNQLLCEKNLDGVDVYKRANIDRRLFSKLLRKDYKPGKNTILALIMSMQLTMAEARELLSYAGYGLAPNNRTDIIISFFLENEIYDMDQINETLYLYGEKCLGNLSA